MPGLNFLIVGLTQLVIAIYGTLQMRNRFNGYAMFVLIVVYGLAYDNLSIAAGAILPEGELLRVLNIPRYWVHALTTPTMMIAAFGALKMTGSKIAQNKAWHATCCLIATALILLGSYVDILNLNLTPAIENGVARYVNDFEFFKGPPVPPVATIVFVLIFGIMLWKHAKFPWLFVGAVLEFIAAGAIGYLLIQNLGEIAFAAGLVTTQVFAAQYQFQNT